MDHELKGSRPHNPWEEFTRRNEEKHKAEEPSRRLCPSQDIATSEVIDLFLGHRSTRLQDEIPNKRQELREFLTEAISPYSVPGRFVEDDITYSSLSRDFALLDDRAKHERCKKSIGEPCDDCNINILSCKKSVPELYQRLTQDRRAFKAEKRIVFMPNLTPAGGVALAASCANRSAHPMRNFLHRYLQRRHLFSVTTDWGFFLEFHIPYHAMRRGPPKKDYRYKRGKRIRKSDPLPLQMESGDHREFHYHEAQTSSLSWGPDEWFWTELFLLDTYFGSESNLHTYLTDWPNGEGFDPPLGGSRRMKEPCFDPREYFLLKLDRRVFQVTEEYTALVETFEKRMEKYARKMRGKYGDDPKQTHTRTISHVLETIRVFVENISGIVDSWDTFRKNPNQMSLFTIHASDSEKKEFPARIERINRNMRELVRLRRILVTKRTEFQDKLSSFHTVSSLRHTEIAITQGEMTVYVAFPLIFTTAIYSMGFLDPKKLWPTAFAVFGGTMILNVAVVEYGGPRRVFFICKDWLMRFRCMHWLFGGGLLSVVLGFRDWLLIKIYGG